MTQEEKQLLLKDICGRLPYGLKGIHRERVHTVRIIEANSMYPNIKVDGYNAWFPIETFKPYLRSMSSITEEELDELLDCEDIDFDGKSELVKRAMLAFAEGDKLLSNALFSMQYAKTVDWLNAHHFDFRNLIERGLAIDCTDLNVY